jgi:hypothetical protein
MERTSDSVYLAERRAKEKTEELRNRGEAYAYLLADMAECLRTVISGTDSTECFDRITMNPRCHDLLRVEPLLQFRQELKVAVAELAGAEQRARR